MSINGVDHSTPTFGTFCLANTAWKWTRAASSASTEPHLHDRAYGTHLERNREMERKEECLKRSCFHLELSCKLHITGNVTTLFPLLQ